MLRVSTRSMKYYVFRNGLRQSRYLPEVPNAHWVCARSKRGEEYVYSATGQRNSIWVPLLFVMFSFLFFLFCFCFTVSPVVELFEHLFVL
jgi:hypothetical protein